MIRFMKKLLVLSLLLVIARPALLQTQNHHYQAPLEIPLFLSGTFAELRSGHFHSGVDFRTQGVEGHRVVAIADGYVSRIAVSPTGFGKALYINHPRTGHTSVYAHLRNFQGEIAEYVKSSQYAQKSFGVNLYPEAGRFRVKKGELIGFSGNTGSSNGPHLHFEIRDADTQEPLNPLYFGFQVKDYIRPRITRFAVYAADDTAMVDGSSTYRVYEVQGWGEQHRLKDHEVVRASGNIAFGISTYDMHNDTPNRNGVYTIKLLVDSVKVFGFRANRFSFGETRYINSFIDYAHFIDQGNRLIRSEIDPYNRLGLYDEMDGKGTFLVEVGQSYQGEYVVTDYHGNVSRLPFTIQGVTSGSASGLQPEKQNGQTLLAGKAHAIETETYFARFSNNAFYRDVMMPHQVLKDSTTFSAEILMGHPEIPVHSFYQLGIKAFETTVSVEKLVIARFNEKDEAESIGGSWENGFVVARTRDLGRFVVMADTIAPEIRPLNFRDGAGIGSLKQLRLAIKDDFSGIDSYRPSLNGQWLLMEYDPKNELLFYDFDEHLKAGANLFELEVRDKAGNITNYRATLHYNRD